MKSPLPTFQTWANFETNGNVQFLFVIDNNRTGNNEFINMFKLAIIFLAFDLETKFCQL